jgi:hypothetical protein
MCVRSLHTCTPKIADGFLIPFIFVNAEGVARNHAMDNLQCLLRSSASALLGAHGRQTQGFPYHIHVITPSNPHLIWDIPRTERQQGLCRTARFKWWPLHNHTTTFSILRYALCRPGFPAISRSLEAGLSINSHIGWTGSWIRSLFCWLFETWFCQG